MVNEHESVDLWTDGMTEFCTIQEKNLSPKWNKTMASGVN
jgi:hypothetical protein